MGNVVKVDYTDEMEQSYIDYAMSVIVSRALPDVRDGLKPVHRRIIYAMNDLNNFKDKPHKKSARIVGDVLGKYHPHGDISVYEAMVRLAQDFNTNHTLIDGQGNFGSIDGDGAAAMRYTEARLENISEELIRDLKYNTVDFKPNFDNTIKEPEVLPANFFNLLINGSTGIAVGMSTNIPPHNLNEINNACKAYLEDENITNRGLLTYIKGPDYPTGGHIINSNEEIKQVYEKGSGRLRVRAKLETESLKGGRNNIIITEIPPTFAGNKDRLIEDLIDKINNRELDEITDIRDESNKDGERIVIEVKKGVNVEKFKHKLFAITKLEDTITINLLAIVNSQPKVMNIKELIKEFIDFRIDIYKKKLNYKLMTLKDKREIRTGLIKAHNQIDLIIDIIRGSKSRSEAKDVLLGKGSKNIKLKFKKDYEEANKMNYTEKQAESILTMQLQRLVSLELNKLKKELQEIEEDIKGIEEILNNKKLLKEKLIDDLDRIKDKYGRYRRTKIEEVEVKEYEEEEIIEDVYLLRDRFNYIKVIDKQSYARTNKETLDKYSIIKLKNNSAVSIFDDNLNAHRIEMKDLGLSSVNDRGIPLEKMNILLIDSEENLKDLNLLFVTKQGRVKLTNYNEFVTNRSKIISTKVKDNDKLIFIAPIYENLKEITLDTKDKRRNRFLIEEISIQGRMTMGVSGINLNKDDTVVKVKLETETNKQKRKRGAKGWTIK